MLLNLSATFYAGGTAAYPDLTLRSQKKKLANNGAYVIQYGRAFLSHYLASGSRDFYHGYTSGRYPEALRYAMGQQDAGQYAVHRDPTGQTDPGQDAQRRGKIDKRPLQLLPKFRRAVMGRLKAREFAPTITPLDTVGKEEVDSYRAAIQAYMYHGEFLKSLGLGPAVAPDGQPLPADMPLDEEDLDLLLADYKGAGAMRLEVEAAQALNKGNYPDQDKQCQADDLTYGSSVLYMAPAGKQRVPRRIDPGKGFFLPSDTGLYENLQAGAHLEGITLAALLAEMEASGYTPSKEELSNLKAKAAPTSASGSYEYSRDLDGMPEAGGTLQVVRFSFLSTDRLVKALGTDKMGNPRWVEKSADWNPNGHYADVKTQDVVNVYEGTLVVDTEIGYGARLAHAQLRDAENPFVAHPLYIVTSPDMLGGISESIVEQCKVPVDMAARAALRMQDAQSKDISGSIAIDVGMLAKTAFAGKGGKNQSPAELVNMLYKEGVLFYNGIDEDGTQLNAPISQIPFEVQNKILAEWNNIANARAEIELITGVNGAVAGNNPVADAGKAVTEQAISGSDNALEFLYSAKQTRFERACRAIVANLKANDPDLAARTMQVRIEQKPTLEQWARFYQSADVALGNKEITLADYTAITEIDNLKEARRLLASRAKRKRMQDMEDAQKNTDYAAQQQTASAEAAEKFKQATLQLQEDLKEKADMRARETQLTVIAAQAEAAERTARITAEYRLKGVETTVQGANEREALKQQVAKVINDDDLDSAEEVAEMQAEAAAKRPAAAK